MFTAKRQGCSRELAQYAAFREAPLVIHRPGYKRFGTDDLAGPEIDLRWVVEFDFIADASVRLIGIEGLPPNCIVCAR